ncbi:hypothetical protein PG991_007702 [Apiospora marii]|uniref:Uncharacterized protein n=1 Tax=Apiospora marii TaxID=335849 RepID=A0ABR1RUD5_9PEZI
MADFSQSIASRKRARETDESGSDPAGHAPVAKKKKKSQRAVAPTYTAEDALKNFSPDDLKALVQSALQDEASTGRAGMEEKLFAASNRIGERISTTILENAEEENAKAREICDKKPKRRAAHFWPAELEPYLHQIRSQLLEGPFAEAPKLAWRTLILFLDLCIDEWESCNKNEEYDDADQDEVEEFHDLAQEIMIDIWRAREHINDWREWFGHADRRRELQDLRDNAEFCRDSRYDEMYTLLVTGD